MTTPVAHVAGNDWIGLGMYLMNRDGAELFGHDGWDEGFQAEAIASLDGGYGLVIMANSDEAANDKPHALASYQAALAASEHDKVTPAVLREQLRATCTAALARLAH